MNLEEMRHLDAIKTYKELECAKERIERLEKLGNEYAVEITTKDGSKRYYLNGIIHREDGPAIECKDGYQAYYLNGNLFTKSEWEKKVSLLEKKEIKYTVYEVDGPLSWW